MCARHAVGLAKKTGDAEAERAARSVIDRVKRELGERGPVRWTDGALDYNRHMAAPIPDLLPPTGLSKVNAIALYVLHAVTSFKAASCRLSARRDGLFAAM